MVIQEGLSYEGIQYLGTPLKEGAENKLVRISLIHLLLEDFDRLRDVLQKSLQYYGRVLQNQETPT
jgi:hypothetical protein